MTILDIIWTAESEFDLDDIFEFYNKISKELAFKIISEIIFETERLIFSEQFQIDDINSNYRRIIVGNYKVLYRLENKKLVIFSVFDCRMNPQKLQNLKR